MKPPITFLVLGVVILIPTSDTQGIVIPGLGPIWELGVAPFGQACTKVGNPSLEPIFGTDPWFGNSHCVTHQGSVGCFVDSPDDPGFGFGYCRCNQGNDAYLTTLEGSEWEQICLGKVGAFCTTEKSGFFPDKLCTPNAYCHQSQTGPSRKVGMCQCLYGFNTTAEGLCEENENVPIPERSTPPTTTTSEAPPTEAFKLPPLNQLIGVHQVAYQQDCYPRPPIPLNRTLCNTYGTTVACLQNAEGRLQCQCNQEADSIYDEEQSMCVGKVGSYCLARSWMLGSKACTKNADFEVEGESTSFDEGYSFGTCECLYGYNPTENGLCERDNSIPDPSTSRPVPTPTTSPSTDEPGDDDNTAKNRGGSGVLNGINKLILFMSGVYFMSQYVNLE